MDRVALTYVDTKCIDASVAYHQTRRLDEERDPPVMLDSESWEILKLQYSFETRGKDGYEYEYELGCTGATVHACSSRQTTSQDETHAVILTSSGALVEVHWCNVMCRRMI